MSSASQINLQFASTAEIARIFHLIWFEISMEVGISQKPGNGQSVTFVLKDEAAFAIQRLNDQNDIQTLIGLMEAVQDYAGVIIECTNLKSNLTITLTKK